MRLGRWFRNDDGGGWGSMDGGLWKTLEFLVLLKFGFIVLWKSGFVMVVVEKDLIAILSPPYEGQGNIFSGV